MGDRESQVRDAGFEVVHEAGDRTVVLAAVVGNDAGRELARNGSTRALKSGQTSFGTLAARLRIARGTAAEPRVESKLRSP
jgi:hypothetical protein